ncbi:MAG: endolytic transglycosylase MltG [Ammonifex sp.]|nr:MAG: endolytic transglycosylase MltG [Ammonifex sp.]
MALLKSCLAKLAIRLRKTLAIAGNSGAQKSAPGIPRRAGVLAKRHVNLRTGPDTPKRTWRYAAGVGRVMPPQSSGLKPWTGLRGSYRKALGDARWLRAAVLVLLCVPPVAAAVLGTYVSRELRAPGGGKTILLTIPGGASTDGVARELHQHGIIKNPLVFRFYARWRNMDRNIQSGTYHLTSGLSTPQVLKVLTDSRQVVRRFTIPEGLTLPEVAVRLEERGIVKADQFLFEATNGRFEHEFLPPDTAGTARLEGYLFPDTYKVFSGISSHRVIQIMLQRFAEVSQEIDLAAGAARQGLTMHQAVTLASLVEREAQRSDERALIAGVLYNRLRRGMPLQVDATVEYALGGHRERILYRDLEVDSPYNTYRITGLPPGPIAAPGRASLIAVVNPENTDYLYYVAKNDGSHAFARTLDDHNANKRRYQGSSP